MADSVTLFGIEVPRTPRRQGGVMTAPSELRVAGVWLLERCIRAALEHTDVASVTLLTGDPDQGIFDLIEKYNVKEAMATDWLGRMSDRARAAGPRDCAIHMRGDVVMRDYESLAKAIEVVRSMPDVSRVVAAYPSKQKAAGNHALSANDMPICPAFEIYKLTNFGVVDIGALSSGAAFVNIEESDFSMLETPEDWLKAERLLQ